MTTHPLPQMTPGKMRGFSLIELMISLTLGLLLISGVGYAYLGSRQTSRQQDALARIQEGARFAFETMGVDIRMAGFTGCMLGTPINGLPAPNLPYWYGYDVTNANLGSGLPVQGYENASASAPSSAAEGSIRGNVYTIAGVQPDALAVLRADNAQQYVVPNVAWAAGNYTFTLAAAPNIKKGDIIAATDCTNTLVSQATNVAGTVVTAPGAAPATAYSQNTLLFPLSGNVYYIRANASGQPSLYRQRLTNAAGNPTTTAEELVEGVEDMQISYGVDTNANCAILANGQVFTDNVIDTYVTADNVAATVPSCVGLNQKWQRVLSVKVSLLLRSTDNNITTQAQTYTFNGVATVAADRRLREVFTTVFAVRNRL